MTGGRTFASRVVGYLRSRWISILSIVTLAVAWEIAGHLSPKSPLRESPLVPPFEVIFGRSLLGMSDYWRIDMWAPMPVVGGAQTYLGAVLALVYHSSLTIFRLASGLVARCCCRDAAWTRDLVVAIFAKAFGRAPSHAAHVSAAGHDPAFPILVRRQ